MAMSLSPLGDNCAQVGILAEDLVTGSELPVLAGPLISKGVVYELNTFRSKYNYSWENLYDWLTRICGNPPSLTLPCVKTALSRIIKKRSELSRNKHHLQIEELFREPFFPERRPLVPVNGPVESRQQPKSDVKLSVRNVNKKLKRRDEKIKQYKGDIADLSKENRVLQDRLTSVQRVCEQNRVTVYRMNKKQQTASDENLQLESRLQELENRFLTDISALEGEVKCLSSALDIAKCERDELAERLTELESLKVKTKEHSQLFLDGVRQCCIELMSLNVGMKQVEPVIRCVLRHLVKLEIDTLPKPATLVEMTAQMKGLACQQLAEQLTSSDKLTLHSDGTSKFGQHYGGFQVSTPDSAYSLGLSEMLTGSAGVTLSTLKLILEDIELATNEGMGNKILACIKNTMSDRHIVEKKFNCLLEDYRSKILPSVISEWDVLSVDEQLNLSSLNNFFCGMHVVVGIADTASATLLQWESNTGIPVPGPALARKSEPGVIRLIRTACKALSKHGCEQSGVYQPFTAFLKSNGVSQNPLASFRGNRFNIVFYDAGALFYIAPLVQKFFKEVWQTPNQLLKAVSADLSVREYVAGCKALGIINKVITGPLWRVLECKDITILDMNQRFQTLVSCLNNWSVDATSVISGEAVIFDDFPPSIDSIHASLFAPSEYDAIVEEILCVLFSAFSSLLMRLVEDHLPGGRYDNIDETLREESRSVPKTNTISERDFAQLDRLLREKPNASVLSLEATILFSNNKTAKWLNEKSPAERAELLKKARACAPEFRRQYQARKQKLLEERGNILQAKQAALTRLQEKKVREKENLTQAIMVYGLWQTQQQVKEGLMKLKSKTAKLTALKAQLDFRKKVLEQNHVDKSIFCLSKNKKKLSVEEVCSNLCKLFQPVSSTSSDQEGLIGRRIKHKWNVDGCEQWYFGTILDTVPGTDDWYNVKYDGEEQVLTLNLLLDIEKGDLEFVNSDFVEL